MSKRTRSQTPSGSGPIPIGSKVPIKIPVPRHMNRTMDQKHLSIVAAQQSARDYCEGAIDTLNLDKSRNWTAEPDANGQWWFVEVQDPATPQPFIPTPSPMTPEEEARLVPSPNGDTPLNTGTAPKPPAPVLAGAGLGPGETPDPSAASVAQVGDPQGR